MLQATGYPAEIADFYSAISAGYWGVFLVAKTVQLVMCLKPRFESESFRTQTNGLFVDSGLPCQEPITKE